MDEQAPIEDNQSIDIKATPHTDGDVIISNEMVTNAGQPNEVREMISRRVLETEDKVVNQALVALGWTPPGGEAPIIADQAMLIDAIMGKGFASKRQREAAIQAGFAVQYIGEWRWNDAALKLLSLRKLLAIYTDGSLNG